MTTKQSPNTFTTHCRYTFEKRTAIKCKFEKKLQYCINDFNPLNCDIVFLCEAKAGFRVVPGKISIILSCANTLAPLSVNCYYAV